MRKLMFLLLLNCSPAFAIEQVFVASHAVKIEKSNSATNHRLEAYDREGYKRISLDKQVFYTGPGNPLQYYYSFGIKETMTEAWRFQEVSEADYKLLYQHLTTTSEPGFLRRFVKGCVAVIDISVTNKLYGGSVNSCITPEPARPKKEDPAPPVAGQSEVAEGTSLIDTISTTY